MAKIITPDPSYTPLVSGDPVRYDVTNAVSNALLAHILTLNSHHNAALVHDGLLTLNNNLKLKDVDASPVGDLLLKVIDQILYIRNSGDSANQKIANECLPYPMSATPAANSVPVSDANNLLVGWRGTFACFTSSQLISFGTTRYIWIWGGNQAPTSAENATQSVMPRDGSIHRLYMKPITNSVNGDTTVLLRKNGADTALTITIPAGSVSIQSDISHVVNFVAGDLLCWAVTTGGTSGTISGGALGAEIIL